MKSTLRSVPARSHARYLLLFLLLCSASVVGGTPLGTDFTYQGKLDLSGVPVNGTADFQFKLFGALTGGTQIGSTIAVNNVTVSDGGFAVNLDFGAVAFEAGDERWIELVVRSPAGSGAFVVLSPRQEITAAPFTLKTRGVDGHSLDASDGSPADAVSVDAAGRVGIGTTSPAAQLHLSATEPAVILQDSATPSNQTGYISFRNSASTLTGWLGFGTVGSPHFSVVTARTGGDIVLSPLGGGSVKLGSTDGAFTVGPTGKVGIGTTAPSRPLTVVADSPSIALEDLGAPSTQTGYLSWLSSTSETAWAGFGTAGSPDFSLVNARPGGDIVLTPLGGGVVRVPMLEITGADLAEKFPTTGEIEPGMVVAIEDDDSGQLCLARGAYNHRVAGVVSGANNFSVGAVLGNLPGHEDAPPIALSGRCYVWCDASTSPIRAGDLLTTAELPGHAMRASDPNRANGAVLGKAMTGLKSGRGMVLVLVNLQ